MEIPSGDNMEFIKKWSWAAFFGTWVFLFANKQYKLGLKFFLFFIVLVFISYAPWFNIVNFVDISSSGSGLRLVYLGFAVWLGIRGREIAWKSGIWQTPEEFKKRQKFVNKMVLSYILVSIVAFFFSFGLMIKPYLENPDLIHQKIMTEALAEAQANNPDLNTVDFKQGYPLGLKDGDNVDSRKLFTSDQTSSYQEGYGYGYMVSCLRKYDDRVFCLKKMLGE